MGLSTGVALLRRSVQRSEDNTEALVSKLELFKICSRVINNSEQDGSRLFITMMFSFYMRPTMS